MHEPMDPCMSCAQDDKPGLKTLPDRRGIPNERPPVDAAPRDAPAESGQNWRHAQFGVNVNEVIVACVAVGGLCEVTATPANTVASMFTVCVPSGVQLLPSGEKEAVNVLPLRTRRAQYGALTHGPAIRFVGAPAVRRVCSPAALPAVSIANTFGAPGSSVVRTITPAFAHGSV